MKKITLLSIVLLFCVTSGYAQRIVRNEVDKFSGHKIVETSNKFIYAGFHRSLKFSLRQVTDGQDTSYALLATIGMSGIEKYTEDSYIQFLLEDGSSIKSFTRYTGLGAEKVGDGQMYFFSTVFILTNEDVKKLQSKKISDIRLTTLGNVWDYSIKENKQDLLIRFIRLINGIK